MEPRSGPAGSKNVKPPKAQVVSLQIPRVMTDTEDSLLPTTMYVCILEADTVTVSTEAKPPLPE